MGLGVLEELLGDVPVVRPLAGLPDQAVDPASPPHAEPVVRELEVEVLGRQLYFWG